jgi:hypothetical protein
MRKCQRSKAATFVARLILQRLLSYRGAPKAISEFVLRATRLPAWLVYGSWFNFMQWRTVVYNAAHPWPYSLERSLALMKSCR